MKLVRVSSFSFISMYFLSNFGYWNSATLYVEVFLFWHTLKLLSLGRNWWDEDRAHYVDLAVLARDTLSGKACFAQKESLWEGKKVTLLSVYLFLWLRLLGLLAFLMKWEW